MSSPALIVPLPALIAPLPGMLDWRPCAVAIAPLPAKKFANKLALHVPNNILKNPPFCSFASICFFCFY